MQSETLTCPRCGAELSAVIGGPQLERKQFRCGTIVRDSGAFDQSTTCRIRELEHQNKIMQADIPGLEPMTRSELKNIVAVRLCKLEDLLKQCGLPVTRMTLIARDPANDDMGICVTNEPDSEIERAFDLALERWLK